MFEAQVLFAGSPSDSGTPIFSPWFQRRGDSALFTIDIGAVSPAGSIQLDVFTKNTEEVGDGAYADVAVNIIAAAPGQYTAAWVSTHDAGLKELVRYMYTVTGSDDYDWVLFRMLEPVWFDQLFAG